MANGYARIGRLGLKRGSYGVGTSVQAVVATVKDVSEEVSAAETST